MKEYETKGWRVLLNGVELDTTPIEYETGIEQTPSEFLLEFYYRRGNAFFFRNAFQKVKLTSNDPRLSSVLVRGQNFELNFSS